MIWWKVYLTDELNPLHKTNTISWNIMNRQELIESYVDRLLENMSTKDLMRIVGDQIEENLESYTDEELISEVQDYYPDLIEEWFDDTLWSQIPDSL